MTLRVLAAGAAITLMSLPLAAAVRADCAADAAALDEQVVAAETGAATGEMPATEHQEEVLSGDAPHETAAGDMGGVEAASPHQREALGGTDEETRGEAAGLLAEAQELAAAGDEAGCQEKLDETRALLPAE